MDQNTTTLSFLASDFFTGTWTSSWSATAYKNKTPHVKSDLFIVIHLWAVSETVSILSLSCNSDFISSNCVFLTSFYIFFFFSELTKKNLNCEIKSEIKLFFISWWKQFSQFRLFSLKIVSLYLTIFLEFYIILFGVLSLYPSVFSSHVFL